MDTVVSVMLNLTNNLLTREDLTLAMYKEFISGWGYIPSPQQVYFSFFEKKVFSFGKP